MDLKEALLKEHSKKQTQAIADFIGNSQPRFDALMKIFFSKDKLLVQRSAWVMSYCIEAYPKLIQKHYKKLLKKLEQPLLHDGVKRNTLKAIQDSTIPESLKGHVVAICFGFLYALNETIAVKAYSINILVRICTEYPELKTELYPLLQELQHHESPAILSSTRNGLAALRKLTT